MKFRHLILPLAVACSPLAAVAATDGTLGANSTGSTDVSVTIGDLVQVLVEQDVGLTYTPGNNSTGATGLCIYRNSNANVNVTLTSGNADAGTFRMVDGTNFLPYTVDFTGSTTNVADVTSGGVNAIDDENNASSTCGGDFSHDLDITVDATDLDAAPAGTYTDTITILVEPV